MILEKRVLGKFSFLGYCIQHLIDTHTHTVLERQAKGPKGNNKVESEAETD